MIDEGVKGYFKGIIPPLWGSTVYRALMLSAYKFAFTYFSQNYEENHWINQDYMGGIRPVVLASAFFASTVRSGVEQPVEYAKVMGQTNKKMGT